MTNTDQRTGTSASPALFELETGSVEEFATLLVLRESQAAHHAGAERDRTHLRRAVCISSLKDVKHSREARLPLVRRYVLTSFAYGSDIVSYRLEISNGPEFSDPPEGHDPREGQHRAYEQLRSEIEKRVSGLGVPVLSGHLHNSLAPGERGR